MKSKIFVIGITLGCLAAGFIAGVLYQDYTAQPEIVVEPRFIEKPVNVVTRIVEKPVYIELVSPEPEIIPEIIEVKPKPIGFSSLDELQQWLDSEEPADRYWTGNVGTYSYNCMDYCAQMIREAALDGYMFTQEGILITHGGKKEAHALCKTSIDGEWIYVDAQTRKIVDKDWR